MWLTDIVISLEQSEYLVTDENDALSVTIVMSDITSQDVIVEVTITDGTATGKYSMYVYRNVQETLMLLCALIIQLGWIIM